jgi:peptidoglycan/LPS O-acetylase OafA/YrhL
LILAITAIVSLILRYRRSRGAERQQMRWGAFALTVTLVVFVSGIVLDVFGIDLFVIESVFTFIAPIGIGVAITRYRLWDLDRLISRTVGYLTVTAVLAGLYGLLVLATQTVVGPHNLPDIAVAAITLLTAAAFGPARRRVQHLVDRRFNRSRYDAARVLDVLAHRLRDEVNPMAVEDDLLLAVADSLQPSHATLWVPSTGRP